MTQASTVERALTVPRPRACYLTGRNAGRMALIAKLPVPVLDALRRRLARQPARASLISTCNPSH